MKHSILTLTLLLALPFLSIGQGFTIVESNSQHVSLRFDLGGFAIDTIVCEGETMHTLSSEGIIAPNEYGMPDLPTFNRFIAVPQGAKAIVEVKGMRLEHLGGINIAPSLGSQCENEPERPYFKDPKVYATDALYPASNVVVAEPQSLRGVDVIHIGICPFQFNPVRQEIVVNGQLEIEIRFEGGNGLFGDDRLRSPYWDPILQNNILNYDCLKPIDYHARRQAWTQSRATGCEYLILTPDNDAFISAAQELADYRTRQGILTQVISISETGATTPGMLRLWFKEIYNNWDIPPAAVCIIGESSNDLQQHVPGCTTLHPSDNFITSDNPYADVNDDRLPDICFSRILAQNEEELPVLIGKIMEYEYTNPVSNPYYYTHPLTAAGWQDIMWFQLTIATISGFLSQHGKTPVRINEVFSGGIGEVWSAAPGTSTLVNYFGPEGLGYIPATPTELGGWTGGTAEQVINAINNGTYLIQHRDHGWNTKWYQPEIYTTDFDAINNVNKLTFLISVNCRTGMYDISTVSFIEELLRMTRNGQNAGIVGAIGPVGQTYSFANDIFLWGVWDLFEPTFLPDYGPYASHSGNWLPAFGCVSGKYFLESQVFPGTDLNMRTTICNTYHTFCDAFIRVFTDIPQPVNATHDESIQCFMPFHITAPEGSQISLSAYINRQWRILATATGTGEEQTMTIMETVPTEFIHLTITGENLLRVEEDIPLEPVERPFVVVDSIAMNGGGLTLHYNQPATVDINVTNVGQQGCDGGTVSMTSTSEQLTITQGQTSFEALPSDESQFIENAFQIELGDDIRDRAHIPFTLTTQFGDETYAQQFDIDVLAPNIHIELTDIDDTQGNSNGLLDPGEFVRLIFSVENNGHYPAESPCISLTNNENRVRVITPEIQLDDMEIDESTEIVFDVFVEFNAGEVSFIDLLLQSTVNGILFTQDILCPVGYVVDSFETGEFELEYWSHDPIHPWTIVTSSMSFDGNHCAKSGEIDHNETSQLTLRFNSTDLGDIGFYARVSSEEGWDLLYFYIDGEEKGHWSGEIWWFNLTFPTTPGQHIYKWAYTKDSSVDAGSDCAWIDYIVLPPHLDELTEQSDQTLTLHPNPTTDQVALELEHLGDFSVRVYDANGRLILAVHNNNTLSFKDLPSGMYQVIVEQNGQRWSRKIIKM